MPKPGSDKGDKGQAAPREATKHVYLTGQTIGDTGYTLKEIRAGEVTVAKGAEERILKIERGIRPARAAPGPPPTRSRAAGVVTEAARPPDAPKPGERPGAPSPTAAAAATPPPPPAMPGAPGGTVAGRLPGSAAAPAAAGASTAAAAAAASATMTQEERIQRALEARRRILERRKDTEGAPAGTTAPVP